MGLIPAFPGLWFPRALRVAQDLGEFQHTPADREKQYDVRTSSLRTEIAAQFEPPPRAGSCHLTTTRIFSRIGWVFLVSVTVATRAKSTEYVPGVEVTMSLTL